ncbi:tetratricopeptide repeat protein [Candidatus Pelagibacter ubique]|uniref:tetratricopeptide repeat protein n=1 Tax=Pelagibacter ubique TaxID=198252 RepID=UPI0003D1A219
MKKIIAIILLIFVNSNLSANEKNTKLEKLFNELKINNAKVAAMIEQEIWSLWSTHPTDQKLTARLEEGSMFVRNQQLTKARDIFTEVINIDQNWAEAWNKRATVLYMMGEFQKSQDDIDKVLALESRHFGALAGQGLVNIQLKNYEKAIRSYEQAQEIYPAMRSPKIMIKQIEELMKQQTI